MAKSTRKIQFKTVWAVDPFEEKNETRQSIISVLKAFAELGGTIDPVYVLSPEEYDVNIEFNAPWLRRIQPSVQAVLEQGLKDIQIPNMGTPQVIVERSPSLTRATRSLVAHSKRVSADLLVVSTHARSSLSRFFLGSFAETLLSHSEIPVLIIGPHLPPEMGSKKSDKSPNRVKNVLEGPIVFPTDFGRSSDSTFRKVVALSKISSSKIHLIHCLPHPVELALQTGIYLLGGGFVSYPDFVTREEKQKRKVAEQMIQGAKKLGVEVEVYFHPGHSSTALAIIEYAKSKRASMIAMAAQSSAIEAALLGSVTRQVVRSAPCPVWVAKTTKKRGSRS